MYTVNNVSAFVVAGKWTTERHPTMFCDVTFSDGYNKYFRRYSAEFYCVGVTVLFFRRMFPIEKKTL